MLDLCFNLKRWGISPLNFILQLIHLANYIIIILSKIKDDYYLFTKESEQCLPINRVICLFEVNKHNIKALVFLFKYSITDFKLKICSVHDLFFLKPHRFPINLIEEASINYSPIWRSSYYIQSFIFHCLLNSSCSEE